MYTFASFYSGCSGSDFAFQSEGLKSIFACDQDDTVCEVYKSNIGPIYNRTIDDHFLHSIATFFLSVKPDVVIGGPPCTMFSLANETGHKNYASSKYASGMINISNFLNCVSFCKPKLFVMENVPRLASDSTRLSIITKLCKQMDYSVRSVLLSSKDFGSCQNRMRLFFFGANNSELLYKLIQNVQNQKQYRPHNSYISWYDALEHHLSCQGIKRENRPVLLTRANKISGVAHVECAPTMVSAERFALRWEKKNAAVGLRRYTGSYSAAERKLLIDAGVLCQRYLSDCELGMIQGFPDWYKWSENSSKNQTMIGNAWEVNTATAIAKAVLKTLS